MWLHDARVRIRGCPREGFCTARAVDDPVPRLLRGWTCGFCGKGDVAEFFGKQTGDPPWPPEMIFEGKEIQ